jgi:hypothetical protein
VQDDAPPQLRLDRRLIGRRGWIGEKELMRSIENLPDVSSKADVIDAPSTKRREPSPQGS